MDQLGLMTPNKELLLIPSSTFLSMRHFSLWTSLFHRGTASQCHLCSGIQSIQGSSLQDLLIRISTSGTQILCRCISCPDIFRNLFCLLGLFVVGVKMACSRGFSVWDGDESMKNGWDSSHVSWIFQTWLKSCYRTLKEFVVGVIVLTS